jgi:CHASE2 domain-containing sensor protein
VAVRPARIVLAAPAGEAIDGLEGRLVVIGGSFRDSGDWHNTPLGAMPGALLVVNAAHALAQYGTPHEPPWWQRLPIALGIIIVVAWLFAVLRPFGASIAASVFLVLLTIPSALLFKSGVMLDLAVPSFGVFAHKFLLEIIERVELVRSKGFRALLADHDEAK